MDRILKIRPIFSVFRQCSTKSTPQIGALGDIDFEDHRKVFGDKSIWDLMRSLAILKICSINIFVDNALPLMRSCEKIIGQRLFSALARPTFYNQFVGGNTGPELIHTLSMLNKTGLRLMVCPAQTGLRIMVCPAQLTWRKVVMMMMMMWGKHWPRTHPHPQHAQQDWLEVRLMVCLAQEEDEGEGSSDETKYDDNAECIMAIGDIMVEGEAIKPDLQFKITALMPADLTIKLADMIDNEYSMLELACKLGKSITSGTPVNIPELSELEAGQLERGIRRLESLGNQAKRQDIRLLVDAEYTYMNPGISVMALGMMLAYNKEQPLVWNTYQCYLKAAKTTISSELEIVESQSCCFGAKIVRGAYMEKERKLAAKKGYPDPVNDTYEDTSAMYNNVVDYMLNHISKVGDRCNVVCGTHNEAGALHVAEKIVELGIAPQSGRVVLGQIYGMADQISIPLAKSGFIVYKSVPYGPLGEVLPYLSRRAAENRVVMAGARKERELLGKEVWRRVTRRT